MSEDTFTEITSESWFSRNGGAFKGIVVGLILFGAAFPVLFWNEGRAVRRYKTLDEGAGSVVSLSEATVIPENEGRLVHVSGKAVTDEIVTDAEFDIAINAIRLQREVSMYQWKENKKRTSKKKIGGGKKTVTTYSYSKSWSSSLIDSSRFKKSTGHQNPDVMPYQSSTFEAEEVRLGEFTLSRSLVGKISKATVLPVDGMAYIDDIPDAAFHGTSIYIGDDPSAPQIGDFKITYRVTKPTDVSIVSRQIDQTFEPYRTRAGGTINMLRPGIVGVDNMFEQARQSNAMWTWILRAGGFILMLIGVGMVLRPLSVAADVVPFLGNIMGIGIGILSLLIAAPFTFLTVALAWLFHRPLIGIVFLVLAGVATGLIFVLPKRLKASGLESTEDNDTPKKAITSDNSYQASSAGKKAIKIVPIKPNITEKATQTEDAGAKNKSVEDLLKEGQKYFKTGRYEEAVAQFSAVIKSGQKQKLALFNRGVALFKLNKKDAARRDFEYAAKLGHEKAKVILNKIEPGTA